MTSLFWNLDCKALSLSKVLGGERRGWGGGRLEVRGGRLEVGGGRLEVRGGRLKLEEED